MEPSFVQNIAREFRSFGTENPHLVVVIARRCFRPCFSRKRSPDKSAYRNVGFARFPVDDKPAYRKVGSTDSPYRPKRCHLRPFASEDWATWAALLRRRRVDTSGLRGRGQTSPASQHPELCGHFRHGTRSNGAVLSSSQYRLVKASSLLATHANGLQ